ncbi:MAG: OmpH family outer membrane protein [Brevinematia bacterium]
MSRCLVIMLFLLLSINLFGYTKVEKIGVIDFDQVFDSFVEDKDFAKEYVSFKQEYISKLNTLDNEIMELKKKVFDLSNKIASSSNNNEVDYQLASEYRNTIDALNSKISKFNQERENFLSGVERYRNMLRDKVIKDILVYIRSYGDKKGYTLIFDRRGNILYVSPGSDPTDDLVKWIKVQEDAKKKY